MTPRSSSSSSSIAAVVTVAATTFMVGTTAAALSHWYHERKFRTMQQKWEEKRTAERTGRIRAEIQLRSALKQLKESGIEVVSSETNKNSNKKSNNTTAASTTKEKNPTMVLKCIGTIVSPYTKRMGTPRQGALAPSSRGFAQLSKTVPMETLECMEQYSHGWIIFEFHANTDLASSLKTKIKPPRAPKGTKVGQLATRSPHRPNPLGLSLVKIEYLDKTHKRLYISALDLVNGTPVYDIKPYVPWDIPGYFNHNNNNNNINKDDTIQENQTTMIKNILQVPDWVDQDDTLSRVEFTAESQQSLQQLVTQKYLAPLYTNQNDGYQGALETIQQVLSQDPRASNRRGTTVVGKKNNKTKTDNSNNNQSSSSSSLCYKIIFCQVQIEFQMIQNNYQDDAIVQIVSIKPMEFQQDSYVDGIPLAAAQAAAAAAAAATTTAI